MIWELFSFMEKESNSNIKQIGYLMKRIKERNESLIYWVENILPMDIKSRSYHRRLLSFMEKELNRNPINHLNQYVVGMHSGPQINHKLAARCPYELLYELNSTIGRIITWLKWNQISSLSSILR